MRPLIAFQNPVIARRLGIATFAFFLAKGLLWLAAPFVFLWFI